MCSEIAPQVFFMHDDGLAYVKEDKQYFGNTVEVDAAGEPAFQMAHGMARVPTALEEATIEAATECPGSCIFLELDED